MINNRYLATDADAADGTNADDLYGAPLLSTAEETALFRAYVATHDPTIRERLILANTRWVRQIAGKYHPRGAMTIEDIEQEGIFGLMTAVEKFDPERGFKFSTYATSWIRQRISRALADQAELIREPVHVQVKRSAAHRQNSDGEPHAPTMATPSVPQKWRVVSLDKPILNEFETAGNPEGATLADLIPAPNAQIFEERVAERDYLHSTLYRALGMLTARERYVIELRYGLSTQGADCLTLEQVGKTMQLTRERVRQIEANALTRLRQLLIQTAEGDACLRMLALVAEERRRQYYRMASYRAKKANRKRIAASEQRGEVA